MYNNKNNTLKNINNFNKQFNYIPYTSFYFISKAVA